MAKIVRKVALFLGIFIGVLLSILLAATLVYSQKMGSEINKMTPVNTHEIVNSDEEEQMVNGTTPRAYPRFNVLYS